MTRAVCPGSFDPVHLGHVDVITRAAGLFDEVVIAIGINPVKTGRLFSDDERIEMLEEVFADLGNVRIQGFHGLIADFCVSVDAATMVKGLRSSADYRFELPMAQMNRHLTGVDTILLTAAPEHSFISSSLIKEVAGHGGDVDAFLPSSVAARLHARLASG
jgi:pantetheine-phosphate adenylyltransferase